MSLTPRVWGAWPLAAVLLLVSGCAAIEATRRSPGAIANGMLTPARAPAANFGADPTRTCPDGGAYGEALRALAKGAKDRGATPPAADGALCAVAEALLSWPEDTTPPENVRAFLGAFFGSPFGAPQVVVETVDTADIRLIGDHVGDVVLAYAAKVPVVRYGLAVERIAAAGGGGGAGRRNASEGNKEGSAVGGRSRVVLVMEAPTMVVEPLPRRLALGQKATLAGTLLGDYDAPKLMVSDAQGRLSELAQPPGKAFRAELACGDKPGRILADVHGEDMGNERALATVEVACGLDLPTSVAVVPAPWPTELAAQEAKVAAGIDAERKVAGLKALNWSEPVGKVARAIAESIRDSARKGSVAVPVDVVQRLMAAELQAPLILQNPAAAPTAEVAFERLQNSPGHRVNSMNPEVTHAGAGVATGTDAAGKPVAYLVELFIKVLPPPDLTAVGQTIRDAIAKKRTAEKLPALTTDPALEKLAQDYAVAVAAAGGKPAKEKYDALVKALNKNYKAVDLLTAVKIDPADYAEEPNILSKGKFLGLGMALGTHPAYGRNSVFVVLLIGNKR